jgi:hypothetical protein
MKRERERERRRYTALPCLLDLGICCCCHCPISTLFLCLFVRHCLSPFFFLSFFVIYSIMSYRIMLVDLLVGWLVCWLCV